MRIFRLMLVLLLLCGWTADAVKKGKEESAEERALRLERLRLQAAENRCAVGFHQNQPSFEFVYSTS